MKNLNYTIDLFLDFLNEKNLAHNSIIAYQRDIKSFLQYAKESITSQNILIQYVESLQNSHKSKSIERKIRSINQWILFCSTEIDLNINIDIPKIKKERKDIKIINNDKIDEILNKINSNRKSDIRLKSIILMIYSTGLRISELINIKLNDIKNITEKNQKSFTVIGKGNKERQVFMTNKSIEALKKYLQSRGNANSIYLWNSGSSHITRQSVFLWLQKLEVSPHDFRHKLASDLVMKGMNLIEVQKILGHESVKTTSIYTHSTDSEQKIKKHHPLSKITKQS